MKRSSRSNPRSGRRHGHSNTESTLASRPEEDLKGILESAETPFVLILDQVQDPHNLGACLRSANAAGAHAVIAPKNNSVSITETVQRVACGAAEITPFIQVTNLARTMKQLQDAGLWLIGTSDQATQSLYEMDLKGPIGLVLGAEGKGIRRLTAENCDFLVQIPMHGSVECLNVSVATGVCLFEAVRQRA